MSEKTLNVYLDTSPLSNANQVRGVGNYTRWLAAQLDKISAIHLERSTHKTAIGFHPDVIHYPFFDLFFPTLPIIKKAPTLVTIHDLVPLLFPDQYPVGMKGQINWFRQKLALQSVDAIITDSLSSKNDILNLLKIDAAKVHVVYLAGNPLIAPVTSSQANQIRRQYHLPKNYVIYVGDINFNKNLVQLIKAIKFLPEQIHLALVGKNFREQSIPEWAAIVQQISLSDLSNRVHFINDLGVTDYQQLSGLYSGAKCLVQPSLYEGFGLPVLEAMQAQTPVVSAHNSSLVEVGGKHAIYAGTQAQELAEAIRTTLLWSDSYRQNWIESAAKWADSFSWQKTAQETVRVYQQIAKID